MCAALTHWFTSIQVRTKIEIRHSERMSNLTIRTKSTARTHTVRVFACQQTDLYSQNQVGSNCHFSIEIQAKTEFWPSIINQIRNFTNTTRQFCKSWNNSTFKIEIYFDFWTMMFRRCHIILKVLFNFAVQHFRNFEPFHFWNSSFEIVQFCHYLQQKHSKPPISNFEVWNLERRIFTS